MGWEALLLSPQFWVSLLGVVSSLVGIWWYYKGKKIEAEKEQKAEIERGAEADKKAAEKAQEERPKVDDSIQKQNDTRKEIDF